VTPRVWAAILLPAATRVARPQNKGQAVRGWGSGLFLKPETRHASVKIDLNGFPRGTRATAQTDGLFKEVKLIAGDRCPRLVRMRDAIRAFGLYFSEIREFD
jgi:hypothetical protein